MSTTSKVLVGFIAFFSLVFFYLAARTLKEHQELRGSISRLQQDIDREKIEIARLRGDVPGAEPNLRQLQVKISRLTVDRGRVFTGLVPKNVATDPAQGKVTITLDRRVVVPATDAIDQPDNESPSVHQIDDTAVLQCFDSRSIADSGFFLGEFKVIGLGDDNVVLENTQKMDAEHIRRIESAAAAEEPKWNLYETMPADRHDVFAWLSEEAFAALFGSLPAEVQAEYRRDGSAAEENDPPERIVDGKYVRRLRNYRVIFNNYARERSVLVDKIAAAKKDLNFLESAQSDSKLQEEFRRTEIERLGEEKSAAITERDTVGRYRQVLADRLASVREETNKTLGENKRLAAIWTQWQQNAARQVDEANGGKSEVGAGS